MDVMQPEIFLISFLIYRKRNLSRLWQADHSGFQTSVSPRNSHEVQAFQMWGINLNPTRAGLLCGDNDTCVKHTGFRVQKAEV